MFFFQGHIVKSLGKIGDLETEIDSILVENSIGNQNILKLMYKHYNQLSQGPNPKRGCIYLLFSESVFNLFKLKSR